MMKNTVLIALFFVSLTALCGCSGWIGEKESASRITGDREEILKPELALEPNPDFGGKVESIPSPHENHTWNNSDTLDLGDAEHLALPSSIKIDQKIDIGAGIDDSLAFTGTPVIGNGMLYVLDADLVLKAYKTDNISKKVWQANVIKDKDDAPGYTGGGIALHKGQLFVTAGIEQVVSYDAETGKELWRKQVNGLVRAAPTAYEDTLLVLTVDNRTYALSIYDGHQLWSHSGITETTSIFGSASPSASSRVAIVPHSSGELYGIRITDGEELWSDSLVYYRATSYTLSDIDASPVIHLGRVYAVSHSGVLTANDLISGGRIWEAQIASVQAPWIAGDYLYVMTTDAKMVALSAVDGSVVWISQFQQFEKPKKQKGRIKWSGPLLAGGKLWVVNSVGTLLGIDPKDGTILSSIDVPDGISLHPIVANQQMYLLSNDATLTVLK